MAVMARVFSSSAHRCSLFLILNELVPHVLPKAKGRVAVITAGRNTAIHFRQSGFGPPVCPPSPLQAPSTAVQHRMAVGN